MAISRRELLRTSTRASAILSILLIGRPAAAEEKAASADDVEFIKNIEYARPDGVSLALNLARPRARDKAVPAIVCIHGGGFRAGNREHHDRLCVQLANRGYVAVTVSYRLAPKHHFPAAVH